VTQAETSKLLKVVPERDGHRVELQWAVPPESKAYKVFPCTYLRYQSRTYISYYRHNVYFYISILVYSCIYFYISIYMLSALMYIFLYYPPPPSFTFIYVYLLYILYIFSKFTSSVFRTHQGKSSCGVLIQSLSGSGGTGQQLCYSQSSGMGTLLVSWRERGQLCYSLVVIGLLCKG